MTEQSETPFFRLLSVSLVLVSSIWGTFGCGRSPSSSVDTLIYARGDRSSKLDPHNTSNGEDVKVIDQIFETLVEFPEEPGESLKPALARSWSSSKDGTVWTFQLRKQVRFHDGTPFTARSVVFSFNRLRHPEKYGLDAPYSQYFSNIEEVKRVDPHTVEFHLSHQSAVFLRNLGMFAASIVSPRAVKQHGGDFSTHPVGTGPYRLKAWTRNEKLVLSRYEEYWGEPAKTPRVLFIPVLDNSQRVQKLLAGGTHIIDGIGVKSLDRISAYPKARLHRAPGMNVSYFAMNTRHEPFDRRAVRRAIAYGINRKRLLKNIYKNIGQEAETPLPPTVQGHHDGIEGYGYNPEKARTILRQQQVDLDQTIRFMHMTNPRPYMPDPPLVARQIKRNLENIGFTGVELVQQDWHQYLRTVSEGEHDLCILGWTTDNGDPDNFLSALFHSRNAQVGSANNVSFFRNDAYDELVDRARRTLDSSKRNELYRKSQEMLHDQVPIVPLAYMPQLAASRKRVNGYQVYSIGEVRLEDVYLNEERSQ